LTATGFQLKQNTDFWQKTENGALDFRSAEKANDRIDVISSEIELLEHVRFTETLEELDTLTVCADLVKDPERFSKVCGTIVGTNFLRITPEMNSLNP
jgi:hypothetical protein